MHTNAFKIGAYPLLIPTIAKLTTLRPLARPYPLYVLRALAFCLPPALALCPLHGPTVWLFPLPLLHWLLQTVVAAPVR
jgi:hypothetical protein